MRWIRTHGGSSASPAGGNPSGSALSVRLRCEPARVRAQAEVEVDQPAVEAGAGGGDDPHELAEQFAAVSPRGVERCAAERADGLVPVVEAANQVAGDLGAIGGGRRIPIPDGRRPGPGARREDRRGRRLTLRPMPITAAGPCGEGRSMRMPAILRPRTRTSLGHLMAASRPVQAVTTSAVATAPIAVSHARPCGGIRPGGGELRVAWSSRTGTSGSTIAAGAVHDRPAATPTGCLLLGQDDEAFVRQRPRRPRREVVGAGDAVPDRNPPPRPGSSPGRARSGRGRADRPARHRPRPDKGVARSRSRRRRAHRGRPGCGRGPRRAGLGPVRRPSARPVRAPAHPAARTRPRRRAGGGASGYSRSSRWSRWWASAS